MLELHLPWLELAILTLLLGSLFSLGARSPGALRLRTLIVSGLALFFAIAAWEDFNLLHAFEAHDKWDLASTLLGADLLTIDQLSAPLLPLTSLMFFLTALVTPSTKTGRFPFGWMLLSQALLLAMLSCRQPWGIIVLLGLQAVPPLVELRARGRSTRVFALHMGLSLALLAGGWALHTTAPSGSPSAAVAMGMLVLGVLIRSGGVPLHCWMTDLFENASLGTALLYVTPMAGAYAGLRLILPTAPDWALHALAIVSLVTSVYAAAMALVQREARRFFVYLFLSHSSLVLIGLVMVGSLDAGPLGLTGGLCVWLSVGLSLTGFGLVLRSLEARTGRLSLADYHGLYDHMPGLAVLFLVTGLASVGFPGTIGFVGAELLIEGAISLYPVVGILIVLAAAFNGIAILRAYFRLFTGTTHRASISLRARLPERLAILTLTALIIGGGLFPQPGVRNRYHAAQELMRRQAAAPALPQHAHTPAHAAVGVAHEAPPHNAPHND